MENIKRFFALFKERFLSDPPSPYRAHNNGVPTKYEDTGHA